MTARSRPKWVMDIDDPEMEWRPFMAPEDDEECEPIKSVRQQVQERHNLKGDK